MTTGYNFNPFTGNFDLVTLTLNVVTETTGLAATKQLYVDGGRVDSYTADGTILRPFKTVQAAINQVIANGDNGPSAAQSYTILIANGTYAEDITLNSTALQNITLQANDYLTGTQTLIGTGSGSVFAIDSSSNNGNLQTLNIIGLSFNGDMRLQGSTNGTSFAGNEFKIKGCNFFLSTQGLVVTNAGTIIFERCNFTQTGAGVGTITNTNFVGFPNGYSTLPDPVHIVTTGGNTPAGFGGTLVVLHNQLSAVNFTVDAGSTLITRSSRIGTSGGSLNISGLMQCYSSFIRSNITVNGGGTLNLRGSEYSTTATLTNSGTVTNDGVIYYTPTTSGDWNSVPLSIKAGVDTLATSGIVKSQTTNKVLASPSGSSGVPSFRALVAADIPIISLTTGVSGVLPIANGGTNASTKAGAFDNLSPMTTSGDIIYGGASGTGTRLPKGSDGTVLTLASGVPAWVSPGSSITRSEVVMSNGVGNGSTSTAVRRFLNTNVNTGTAITMATSSTLGSTFTINEDGIYSVTYTDSAVTTNIFGITVNNTSLTVWLQTYATGTRAATSIGTPTIQSSVSWTGWCFAGDVIRAMNNGTMTDEDEVIISIVKVNG